jgi:RNA polymerase sigma-70 factor (ECF subfamily)
MDTELVEAARSGDEEAFSSLARASADRLLAVAYRILRDGGRAEDAVQQALINAWRQLPGLREPERFDAWLHRLLVHACYAEARQARIWHANVRMLPLGGISTPDPAIRVDERDTLDRAFARLKTDQRAVFVLHHYLGLPLAEVAETLGVPIGTVKSRLHYATNTLRAAIDADARPALTARERTA